MTCHNESWLYWALIFIGIFYHTLATSKELPSDPLTVDEIVRRTNCMAYYQGSDGRARVSMVITDSQGRERKREFTILRKNQASDPKTAQHVCNQQKYYVYFHRPADVNRTVFLVWKQQDKADNRWLYLPALDVVKRIAASDKRTSFVGSHFYYEDITGRDPNEDQHKLSQVTDDYYVLENIPHDPASVEFSNYRIWIYRKNFVPVKVEYFDKKGDKFRVYEAQQVKYVQGFPTIIKSQMKDLRTGGITTLHFDGVRYNIDQPNKVFTERYLRNPPRRYLR